MCHGQYQALCLARLQTKSGRHGFVLCLNLSTQLPHMVKLSAQLHAVESANRHQKPHPCPCRVTMRYGGIKGARFYYQARPNQPNLLNEWRGEQFYLRTQGQYRALWSQFFLFRRPFRGLSLNSGEAVE